MCNRLHFWQNITPDLLIVHSSLFLGPSIVSALSVMKVGGCYNVTGLPEYSSGIGFRVDTGLERGAIAVGRKY